MKLKNRLFLAFFLFAFLPVAVISFIGLELALDGLDRIASPGIGNALANANSLVELTLAKLETECSDVATAISLSSSAEDYLRYGFDIAVVVQGSDTSIAISDRAGNPELCADLVSLINSRDQDQDVGRTKLAGEICVYCVHSVADTVALSGYLLGDEYHILFDDLGTNLHRFNQLRLLKASGRKFTRVIWAGANLLYLFVILFVSRTTARSLTRPLSKLGDLVEKVGPYNWDVRLEYDKNDEVGTLAAGFNRMSSRLSETTRKLIEAEKTAAWQQTARVIAHGIKNILAPIKLAMARLSKNVDQKDLEVMSPLGTIRSELELLEKTAGDFSIYGRNIEIKPSKIDLNMAVRQAVGICEPDAENKFINLSLEEDIPMITADENMVREVLVNLIKNACEATDEGGSVKVITKPTSSGVEISISDTGSGIAPEIEDQIFEPYVTTKPNGTGLGLAIVKKIVVSSGGNIIFETGAEGTTFRVLFAERDE